MNLWIWKYICSYQTENSLFLIAGGFKFPYSADVSCILVHDWLYGNCDYLNPACAHKITKDLEQHYIHFYCAICPILVSLNRSWCPVRCLLTWLLFCSLRQPWTSISCRSKSPLIAGLTPTYQFPLWLWHSLFCTALSSYRLLSGNSVQKEAKAEQPEDIWGKTIKHFLPKTRFTFTKITDSRGSNDFEAVFLFRGERAT